MSDRNTAVPDWKRLRYPDEATFERVLRDHEHDAALDDGSDYRPYLGLPAWIRLGWPSKVLWDVAARTGEIDEAQAQRAAGQRVRIPEPWPVARVPWADVLKTYPPRPGVPDHEQDHMRVVTLWPSVYGEPMVEFSLHKVITVNSTVYNKGPQRAPRSVATGLRDADQRAVAEITKAAMGKSHPDREMVISALQGASS